MSKYKFSTDEQLLLVAGKWIEFDDDSPIAQREEDITKLSGGGKLQSNLNFYDCLVLACLKTSAE